MEGETNRADKDEIRKVNTQNSYLLPDFQNLCTFRLIYDHSACPYNISIYVKQY